MRTFVSERGSSVVLDSSKLAIIDLDTEAEGICRAAAAAGVEFEWEEDEAEGPPALTGSCICCGDFWIPLEERGAVEDAAPIGQLPLAAPIGELFFAADGTARCIYSDDLVPVLAGIGKVTTRRASMVEPAAGGGWEADMAPSGGPVLRGFALRRDALAAEREWLRENVLGGAG